MAIRKTGSYVEGGGDYRYGANGDGGLRIDGGSQYSLTSTGSGGPYLRVGRYEGNKGTLTVTGTGSLLEITSTGVNLGNAGASANFGRDGGSATVNIVSGGKLRIVDSVGTPGSSDNEYITVGRDSGTGTLTLRKGTVEIEGTGAGLNIGHNEIDGIAGANGKLVLEENSLVRLAALARPEGSTSTSGIDATLNIGRNNSTGDASVKNSAIQIDSASGEAYLAVGRNGGTGTLTVTGTGKASQGVFLEGADGNWADFGRHGAWVDIGRHAGSKGTVTIDKARLQLESPGTGIADASYATYATVAVGRQGGEGKLVLQNGAVLSLKTAGNAHLNIGVDAESKGTLDVRSSTISLRGAAKADGEGVFFDVGLAGGTGSTTLRDSKVTLSDADGARFAVGYRDGANGKATLINSSVSLSGDKSVVLVGTDTGEVASPATGRLVLQTSSKISFGKQGGDVYIGGTKGEVLLQSKSVITGFTDLVVGTHDGGATAANGLLSLAAGTRVAGDRVSVTEGGTLKAATAKIEGDLAISGGTVDLRGNGLNTLSVSGDLVSHGGILRLDVTKAGADHVAFTGTGELASGLLAITVTPSGSYRLAKGETNVLLSFGKGTSENGTGEVAVSVEKHHAGFAYFAGILTAKPGEFVLTALNSGKSGGASSFDLSGGTTGAEVSFDAKTGIASVEGGRVSSGETHNTSKFLGTKFADNLEAAGGKLAVNFSGKGGNDTLTGASGSDTLDGGAGNDVLKGGAGNDTLKGGSGNDTLDGGAGRDVLEGGSGKDTLYGGTGADKLYGGTGADTFVFKSVKDSTVASSGRDTIYDFKRAQGDKIHLSAIDADTKTDGHQEFDFIGTKKFSKTAGELRYEKKSGDTFVYGDVNGDGKADFAILIDASISLKESDFILV